MSHSLGAARFPDGKVLWFEYDGTCNTAISCLYGSVDDVARNWRKHWPMACTCDKQEPVELFADYGDGLSWDGFACRDCRSIDAKSLQPYALDWAEPATFDGFPVCWQCPRHAVRAGIPGWVKFK